MSSSLSPLTFTGVSKYSDDFQTILSRQSSIANLPVKELQNQQTDNLQRKVQATNLQDAMKTLSDSLQSLSSIGDHQGVSGSSSDTGAVTIVSTSATAPATFTISEITSVAGAASETSKVGYADSKASTVSPSGSMSITVGTTTVPITLSSSENNLVGLRDKINGLGLGVTATILTTGTGATPNYLSVTSDTTGKTTLSLTEDPNGTTPSAWLTSANQGSNAEFKLNGVAVSKTANLINDVAPGVTFQIEGKTANNENVTLSLTSDRSKLGSALNSLVSAYNTAAKQVDSEIGESAGVLTGDYSVREAQNVMRRLTSFQGSGSVKSLADLGLEMSTTGEMSLNQDTFDSLTDSQLSAAFQFVGTTTSGLGSLQSSFNQISDPVTGLIQVQINQYSATDTRLHDQIADLTDRNSYLQETLSAKLQQADTLLASLESQQSVLTASLQSLSMVLYGKQTSSS